jgi:hypothetical protein
MGSLGYILKIAIFLIKMATYSYVQSQKGGQKLAYNGYVYRNHRYFPDGKSYWKCDRWDSAKCKGRAILDYRDIDGLGNHNQLVRVTQQHNHPPPSETPTGRRKSSENVGFFPE